MSKRSKHTAIEKYHCILPVLRGEASISHTAKRRGVSSSTIQRWVHKYKQNGLEELKESNTWNRYSEELKYEAIKSVLSEKKSISEVTKKFGVSNESVLSRWISKYNDGRKLSGTTGGRGKSTMNKGRKTTLEERIEIVQFTIANGQDYQLAIDKYKISYQQIYSWVKKYKEQGEIGLQDLRGRTKNLVELTENERLQLRIKELEARNQYLEMENDFAKKLQEIRSRPPH
ncbi:transposase [Enterococcus sp. LJL98]